jgi:phenylpropionate dioxygenase-like ring-hydroxylating dioxygenase large terminal subunit
MTRADAGGDKTAPARDGSAYGRGAQRHNATFTEVGPHTPCGEYLRRYWHPVAVSAEVGPRPKKIKVLGEELIVFRDGKQRPGLLHPRCAHRGSNLYYGRIEERGIRCCYHGWLFDTQGHCLEQPCEPQGGARRDQVRQPWYPLQERYGLVFAYLGPPEKRPLLPRFAHLESLQPGEKIFAVCSPGATGFGDVTVDVPAIPYNWFQFWENNVDPYHVWILHSTFSDVVQFAEALKIRPRVQFERSGTSVIYHAARDIGGKVMDRVGQCILPNIISIADVNLGEGPARSVNWAVPVDDTSFLGFGLSVGREFDRQFDAVSMTPDGKTWNQMSDEEHQSYPGDFEAQASQGTITLHSEEHLVHSDEGVVMLRRLVLHQIAAVSKGKDPAGVAFSEEEALIQIAAGNFFV